MSLWPFGSSDDDRKLQNINRNGDGKLLCPECGRSDWAFAQRHVGHYFKRLMHCYNCGHSAEIPSGVQIIEAGGQELPEDWAEDLATHFGEGVKRARQDSPDT